MLALIYLGMAIASGDLLCRRFYRFVSISHRWAAAILVGIFLSTWFTYLAGLAFAHTGDTSLWADLLFFVIAFGAIFWFSRKAPKKDMIAPRAPRSSRQAFVAIVRLPDGTKPPSGAIVPSSNSDCQNCDIIQKSGVYELYRAK